MTPISTCTSLCPGENEGGVDSWNSVVIMQYCVVSNTEYCYLMICIQQESLETSVMWLFVLCNAQLLTLSVAFNLL